MYNMEQPRRKLARKMNFMGKKKLPNADASLQAKVEYFIARSNEIRAASERIRGYSEEKRMRRQQSLEVVSKPPSAVPRARSAKNSKPSR
jgi:hypothetical protein